MSAAPALVRQLSQAAPPASSGGGGGGAPPAVVLPLVRPRAATEIVVGIADMQVSGDPAARIVTYALGSCLGLVVHDPVAGVGGLLHAMLPTAALDAERARLAPYTFVDSGVPLLFKACYALGAKKERMTVKVAGGAFSGEREEDDMFQIGKRNLLALRKLLWKNGVILRGEDVGGCGLSRTLSLAVGSGDVLLKMNGAERAL